MARHAFTDTPEQFRFVRRVMSDVDCAGSFGLETGWDLPCASFATAEGFDHEYPVSNHATVSLVSQGVPMTRVGGKLDGRSGGVGRGGLLLYSGGYARHWLSQGGARSRQFYFGQSLIRECGEELGGGSSVGLRDDVVFVDDAALRGLLNAYFTRASNWIDPPTRLEMDSHAALITLRLVSAYSTISARHRQTSRSRLSGTRLSLVLDLIEAGLDDSIRIADLAQAVGLGVSQFSVAFRDAVGLAPHRYVMHRRIDRAKSLLATSMPAAEIAIVSGFSSQQHLCSVFRQLAGITPQAFRLAQCLHHAES